MLPYIAYMDPMGLLLILDLLILLLYITIDYGLFMIILPILWTFMDSKSPRVLPCGNSAALNPRLWRRPYFCGVSDFETADKNEGQVPHAEELPMLRYCLGYNHTNLWTYHHWTIKYEHYIVGHIEPTLRTANTNLKNLLGTSKRSGRHQR